MEYSQRILNEETYGTAVGMDLSEKKVVFCYKNNSRNLFDKSQ